MSSDTIARPRPLPPWSRALASSRRTNRRKTRLRSSGGMPGPSSSTVSVTQPLCSSSAKCDRRRGVTGGVGCDVADDACESAGIARDAGRGIRRSCRSPAWSCRAGGVPRRRRDRRGPRVASPGPACARRRGSRATSRRRDAAHGGPRRGRSRPVRSKTGDQDARARPRQIVESTPLANAVRAMRRR